MKYKLIILFAAFVYAVYLSFNKVFLSSEISVIEFATGTAISGSIFAVAYLLVSKKSKELGKIDKKSWLKILLLGIIMGVVYKLVLFYGQSKASVTNAGLLLRTSPLFSLLLGIIFLKETVRVRELLLMFLMLVGVFFVLTGGEVTLGFGGMFLILGGFLIGFDHVFSRFIVKSGVSPSVLVSFVTIIGAVLLSFYSILFTGINLSFWLAYLVSGVSTFLAVLLRNIGLKEVKASVASSILLFSPFFTAAIGVVFLKEEVNLEQIIGGLILISKSRNPRPF